MEIKATNVHWEEGLVDRKQRWNLLGGAGCTVWFTGLPASGKTTIASALEHLLVARGIHAYRLDGDNIRFGLNKNLGFSRAERRENIRRIGEVSILFADSGAIALTAFISPYIADRNEVRWLHDQAGLTFVEVLVDAPLSVCEQRDPKGQYAKARQGVIKGFTGIDDPYEPPLRPELVLKTAEKDVASCVHAVVELLERRRLLRDRCTVLPAGGEEG